MIPVLAFLPVTDVPEGVRALRGVIRPEAEELLDSFDATYVTGKYRNVMRNGIHTLRRIPPLFPPNIWNVHDVTLEDGERTNNLVEGNNNKFRILVGIDHPNIYRLIIALRELESNARTLRAQTLAGAEPARKRSLIAARVQERLRTLYERYVAGDVNILDFFTRCQLQLIFDEELRFSV